MSDSLKQQIIHGEELFEHGRFQEALGVFEHVLRQAPDHDGALNDAALTCAELGLDTRADAYFEEALRCDPANRKAFFNYLDHLVRRGRLEAASSAFERLESSIPVSPEKHKYAEALSRRSAFQRGAHVPARVKAASAEVPATRATSEPSPADSELPPPFQPTPADSTPPSALEAAPVDSASPPAYEAAPADSAPPPASEAKPAQVRDVRRPAAASVERMKVAFVCMRNDHFLLGIEAALARHHDVRTLHFNYGAVDLRAVQELMDWADVTWFEWCDGLLVEASRRLRKSSHTVARLHRFEAFTEWPRQVDWRFVDSLILVSPPMLDALRSQHPHAEHQTDVEVIYNGVDVDRFIFKERRPGFDVACVADLRSRKNPSLMLQCIDALRREDSRYKLHIAGGAKEPDVKLYFDHMVDAMGLRDNVTHYGWVSEIDAWLDDKQYVLSTSMHESFGYGIVESMARGLKPLIHNFPGAATIFPRSALFNTLPEFVRGVRDDDYDSHAYRDFVERNYAQEIQVERIESVLRRLVFAPSRLAI